MTIFRHTLLALVMGVLFLGLTPTASAASFFGPIVPEACQACPCGFGGVLDAMRNVMNLGIAIAVAVATIIIAWGGFLYIMSPANPESRSTANKMLINAAIGLLIVLSAWLIVDFVMKTLYSGPDGEAGRYGPWNAILTGGDICVQPKPTSSLFKGKILAVPGVDTGGTGVISAGEYTTAQAASALKAGGVGYNQGITMDGTRADTISQAVALKAACGCTVTVTSTTGGSHAGGTYSHSEGYKIDVGLNSALNAYIQGKLRAGGNRSDGAALYYDKCGNAYAKESDHWDILVNKGVCSL